MVRFEPALSLWLLSAFLINTPAQAAVAKTATIPFQKISERNLFGLKPPVIDLGKPIRPVLSQITLTGITTILGRSMALFKVQDPDRAGKPAAESFLMLSEGQSELGIAVLAIDMKAGSVRVNNHGEIQTLSLPKNAVMATPRAVSELTPGAFNPQPDSAIGSFQVPPPLKPEEQQILIEAQRLKALQDGDPIARILPPTELGQQMKQRAE